MIASIPFVVPAMYKAALSSGELVRFGALLKDSGSGQIVAHLQETGLMSKLVDLANVSPFSPLGAVNMASSVYGNVQLTQLKSLLSGMQAMQYATLGVAVAGIGVSIAGFALMNKKLNQLDERITELGKRIDEAFRVLREGELRVRFSRLQGLFERAQQAHSLRAPANEWYAVAGMLADESAYFRGEVKFLLEHQSFDKDLFSSLVSAMAMCNTGRVECMVLSNELPAAKRVSEDVGRHYGSLFDGLSHVALAGKVADESVRYQRQKYFDLRDLQVEMRNVVAGVREMTDAALTRPALIGTLIENEIDGYQYVRSLSEETVESLLLLPS